MTSNEPQTNQSVDNRVRDFAIYLWMQHTNNIDGVSDGFGLSKSRIRQIIKAVDEDYTAYSIPYWKHVEEVEASA